MIKGQSESRCWTRCNTLNCQGLSVSFPISALYFYGCEKEMSLLKILLGFTVLNVLLQVMRGNGLFEIAMAWVLVVLTSVAIKLWAVKKNV